MFAAATTVHHPIKFDEHVLITHPSPDGRLHNEVKTGFGLITKLTGWTWTEQRRELPSNDATMHKSVYERFDLPAALSMTPGLPTGL